MSRRSTQAPELEAFVRFEQGMMDYLFSIGHLSRELRPLWEQRLRARLLMPAREARAAHRMAVRDCLAMSADWPTKDRLAADRYLHAHGACTTVEVRRLLDGIRKAPAGKPAKSSVRRRRSS